MLIRAPLNRSPRGITSLFKRWLGIRFSSPSDTIGYQ